jgi:hypothetical protein
MTQSRSATWESDTHAAPVLRHILDRFRDASPAVAVGMISDSVQGIADCFAERVEDTSIEELSAFGEDLLRLQRLDQWLALLRGMALEQPWMPNATGTVLDLLGSHLGATQMVRRLVQACSGAQPDASALREYLSYLGPQHLKSVAHVAPHTEAAVLRSAIIDFVSRAAARNPQHLSDLASDPDPDLAQLALDAIPQLSLKQRFDALRGVLAQQSSSELRRHALEMLKPLAVEARRELLAIALRDPDPCLRQQSAVRMGETRGRTAAAELLRCMQEEVFPTRHRDEQLAFYEGLTASADSEASHEILSRLLQKPSGVFSKMLVQLPGAHPDPLCSSIIEMLARRACPGAREILERGAESPYGCIARACRKALGETAA